MRLQQISGTTRILASGLVLLGCTSLALAGACRCCNPCPNGVNGGFFGYYPTNWRPWPSVTVSAVPETIPAPVVPASPLPPGPSIQQAPPPRPVDKPMDQSSSPSPVEVDPKADTQPYFAPPQ
jgi:hypothetical protein